VLTLHFGVPKQLEIVHIRGFDTNIKKSLLFPDFLAELFAELSLDFVPKLAICLWFTVVHQDIRKLMILEPKESSKAAKANSLALLAAGTNLVYGFVPGRKTWENSKTWGKTAGNVIFQGRLLMALVNFKKNALSWHNIVHFEGQIHLYLSLFFSLVETGRTFFVFFPRWPRKDGCMGLPSIY